jgi:Flp pilus assembly protein TadG
MLRRLRTSRGQTLIEFAFVAPLVLVFLLAIVDFGIALDRRIVLDHAVREGARLASVGGHSLESGSMTLDELVGEIKTYTADQSQGIADGAGVPGAGNYIDVCYDDANGNGTVGDVGDNVQVRVHYQHDFVTGFTSMFDSDIASIDMNPASSARVERPVDGTPASCGAWPPS